MRSAEDTQGPSTPNSDTLLVPEFSGRDDRLWIVILGTDVVGRSRTLSQHIDLFDRILLFEGIFRRG
jgi:hypothetical protein